MDLGATALYLTPIFPGRSNHRYNATTFAHVDPVLGGDEALVRLSRAVHERGMHIIGDLTTNHSGDDHEWFVAAQADPAAAERGFYYVADDGSYAAWLDVATLPKFDLESPVLRERMYGRGDSVVARWLRAAVRPGRLADRRGQHDRAVRAVRPRQRRGARTAGHHGRGEARARRCSPSTATTSPPT